MKLLYHVVVMVAMINSMTIASEQKNRCPIIFPGTSAIHRLRNWLAERKHASMILNGSSIRVVAIPGFGYKVHSHSDISYTDPLIDEHDVIDIPRRKSSCKNYSVDDDPELDEDSSD